MIKVICAYEKHIGDGEFNQCSYNLEKLRYEHIINALYREGGNALKNICPKCGNKTLVFDYSYTDGGKIAFNV